jgi:signal transduction histidine kinase
MESIRPIVAARPRRREVTIGPERHDQWPTAPPDRSHRAGTLSAMDTTRAKATTSDPTLDRPGLAADALEALDAATRAIAEILDLEAVLQVIVERVRDLVDARYAALGIADAQGRLERFITVGLTPEVRAAIGPLPVGHGLLGVIIREGRTLRIPDIARHPDSYGFPPHHPPMTSLLGVPITVGGRAVGDLYLTDKQGATEFSDTDQRIVELFARHAGIAIENARLHDRLAALRVVAERERIGRDLHDGVIQGLYAVSLSLEDVQDLVEAGQSEAAVARVDAGIDAIHRSIGEIREFIVGLRPGLEDSDLLGGIAAHADHLRMSSTIEVHTELSFPAGDVARLSAEARGELLHLVREALSNVARHSRASQAWVSVRDVGSEMVLEIRDNGVGFDANAVRAEGHHGLINLRQRAAAAGGRLELDTMPGTGTRLVVRVPVPSGETDR